MLSTYSSITNGQASIDFAPGTIIDARGQIGVIVDVLHSAATANMVLYVRFVHNIGNARQYDVMELTPERIKALGVDQWKLATVEQLRAAIDKRRQWLERELQTCVEMAAIKPDVPTAAEHKYVFLYHGVQDWESFTGTLDEAKRYATSDRRHQNYGRMGVTVARYEAVYQSDMLDDKESEL